MRWREVMSCACIAIVGATTAGCSPQGPNSQVTQTSYEDYATNFADWSNKYVECARSFGADARVTPEGSISNPVAPGRSTTDGLDSECIAKVGSAPAPPELTPAFLAGLYELYVEQANCLRELGYVIPDPPSRREWVENYGADSWEPISQLNAQGAYSDEAFKQCPQPDPREAERVGSRVMATQGS